MGLLDDLENVTTGKNECTVAGILRALPENEAAALIKSIDNPLTLMASLSRILTRHGHPIRPKTLTRHRKRGMAGVGCICP